MVGIGYQLPSEKHHHLFFAKLPLNQQTVQAPPPPPQFEFLVMTEKNIFAYKLFLPLNIPDFNFFVCENCNPPLKVEVLSRPPLF